MEFNVIGLRSYHKRPKRATSATYTPAAIAKAYGFAAGSAPGSSKPIGIIELGGGYRTGDLSTAFSTWNLPYPAITAVSVAGGANTPGGNADGEVMLDIQVAAGIYSWLTGKIATIRVYFAPNTDDGFRTAISQAIADGCGAISISWGGPEDSWSAASISAFDAVCAQAVAAGCTVYAAAGDNDSGDGEAGDHVDFPGSSPHVVSCGGTTKTSSDETVWNNGPGEGTGGGYSVNFPVQPWQVGAPLGSGRMVPDLAANADPNTGYQIYLDGQWQIIGGTSAVAPLYAGLTAALGGGLTLLKAWANPQAFTDITVGNNGDYQAAVGPDPCTGLGVPNGPAFTAAFGPVPVVVSPPPPPPVGPPVNPSPPPPSPPILPPPPPPILGGGTPVLGGGLLKEIVTLLKEFFTGLGIPVGNGKLIAIAGKILLIYIASGGTTTLQQIIQTVFAGLIPPTSSAKATMKLAFPTVDEIEAILSDVETAAKVVGELLSGLEAAAGELPSLSLEVA